MYFSHNTSQTSVSRDKGHHQAEMKNENVHDVSVTNLQSPSGIILLYNIIVNIPEILNYASIKG